MGILKALEMQLYRLWFFGSKRLEDRQESECQIRLNLLVELVNELYDSNLSDVISVKEWLEAKAEALRTSRGRVLSEPRGS
jgi:hypothetical protein